jgi:hypothetical protein
MTKESESLHLELILRRAHRLNQDLKTQNAKLQLENDVLKDDIVNLGGIPSTAIGQGDKSATSI